MFSFSFPYLLPWAETAVMGLMQCCQGLETRGRGQGQGLDVRGRGRGRGLDVRGRGRGQGHGSALIHTYLVGTEQKVVSLVVLLLYIVVVMSQISNGLL